jgi:hypothetical protein
VGKDGIDKLVDQNQAEAKPLSLSFRLGGLYDSRVGATSSQSSEEKHKDTAIATTLGAGWQFYKKENLGLRMDYNGYANFYEDYNEYNVIDQTVSLEPQYYHDSLILSIPLSYNYVLEDTRSDFYRYSMMPTITYLLPGFDHAVSINGFFSHIVDKDDLELNGVDLDEDGDTSGGGCAYLFYFVKNGRIRISADYQHTKYDDTESNYAIFIDSNYNLTSQDKREDDILLANLDVQFQLNSFSAIYSSYSYILTHSNIELYDYDRNVVEAGVSFRY